MTANEEQLHQKHSQLVGYVASLYEEANKLSAKQPRDHASLLMVRQINRVIGDVHALVEGEENPFISDIEAFDLYGGELYEMPENRDVVLVLRQVKDALDRMEQRHHLSWAHL